MEYKGFHTMWYRFDSKNVKYIRKFPIDTVPENNEGYTEWKRGTGPLMGQQYINVANGVSKACKGIPKKPETKLKMRLAKLGVPKTVEHRYNLSLAHKRRRVKNGKTQSNKITEARLGQTS